MPFLKDLLANPAQKSAFMLENQTFIDSLYLFCAKDKKTSTTLDSIFTNRKNLDIQAILNGKRNDQKAIMLSAIYLNNTAAACNVANYLNERIHIADLPRFDSIMPMLTTKQKCIGAGEIFKGEVSGAYYQNKVPSNVTCIVNGKTLPIMYGFGKFQEKYKSSGIKKTEVNFLVLNPVTQATRIYSKEFQIQISD
jgi:hypothetical protein